MSMLDQTIKRPMTTAARCEDLQKRLQLVREQREREQRAYDAATAEHGNLTTEEIRALVSKKAEEDVPTSMNINGATVCVHDYVATVDDEALLLKAEKGLLVPDFLKHIYLGERGKVVRLLSSFKGKPAVELRFADGVEKIFFAECVAVGERKKKTSRGVPINNTQGAERMADPSTVDVPQVKAPPPLPEPLPLPGWGGLKKPSAPKVIAPVVNDDYRPLGRSEPSSVPAPSPHVPAAHAAGTVPSLPVTVPLLSLPVPPAVTPPVSVSRKTTTSARRTKKLQNAVTKKARSTKSKETGATSTPSMATPELRSGLSDRSQPIPLNTMTTGTSSTPVALPASASAPSQCASPSPNYQCIGLVKEAFHAPSCRVTVAADDGLGLPYDFEGDQSLLLCTAESLASIAELDNLLKTPRTDLLYVASQPSGRLMVPMTQSRIPRCAPPGYRAKFSFADRHTRIPRFTTTAKSTQPLQCFLRGHLPNAPTDIRCVPFTIPGSSMPLEKILDMATNTLAWGATGRKVTRLFSDDGLEVVHTGGIQNGMHLVATMGSLYRLVEPADVEEESGPSAQTPPVCMPQPAHPSKYVFPAPVANDVSPATPQSHPLPATIRPVVNRRRSRCPSSSVVVAKPIHIKVFENGNYDDRYAPSCHTITIRPTHKSLLSVMGLITRELGWNGTGAKVSLLYDASGAVIEAIDELHDGKCVVASAGDRFVVPYPDSALHREALKLLSS